jgi:hypothetical protein
MPACGGIDAAGRGAVPAVRVVALSGFGELAFPRDPFMRFVGTLDPIFAFAITGEQFDDLVDTTRHILTDCRFKLNHLSNFEFVGRHIAPLSKKQAEGKGPPRLRP